MNDVLHLIESIVGNKGSAFAGLGRQKLNR